MAKRPKSPMPVSQRAKIFAPFDALRGFSAALRAKEKIIQPKRLLLEDKLEELNRKASELKKGDYVSILYYCDGEYLSVSGFLSDINMHGRTFAVAGKEICFDDIFELD
ncbi:MAG: YolD-like family protein [Lachnospiraceae bacterium]|nr:YolD-like family protein [Lachnospiraceae bacterium]